jgi:curved DNA-binding protein CbpA
MELDPYKVLGISYDADLKQIRDNFKKLVLINHPDRGGNARNFEIIKNAYSYLYKYKINQQKQLQKEQRTFDKYTNSRNFQTESLDREFSKMNINPNDKNLDKNKFNKLFELHKISDADDRGYQSKRSKERLDYDEIQRRNKNKKQEKLQIQVYEEPEPLELTTDNYKRLGVKYVKDFSQNVGKQGSNYCDFQKAYTEFDTQNMTNHRKKNYKSVDDYKRQRENQNFSISPEQALKMEVKKKQELAMEEKRRFYVSRQDKKIEKKFKSFQNYLQL